MLNQISWNSPPALQLLGFLGLLLPLGKDLRVLSRSQPGVDRIKAGKFVSWNAIPTRGDLRMVFENQTNLFFSPLLLLRASLCLFLCKKWGEKTKHQQHWKCVKKCFHLEHHRGDKTLDLGRRKLLLLAILEFFKFDQIFFLYTTHGGGLLDTNQANHNLHLKGKGPLDNVLADVIFLGQVKQLPKRSQLHISWITRGP